MPHHAINSLKADTHQTHTKTILRKQACEGLRLVRAWFKNSGHIL